MAQKTDLNVAPYYDDFDITDNFHRVLFRPGFAVQARELTQLQSILQNQIERHAQNVFKEGTIIIPGQLSVSNNYTSIQLASQFGGEDVVVSQYLNTTTPVTITPDGFVSNFDELTSPVKLPVTFPVNAPVKLVAVTPVPVKLPLKVVAVNVPLTVESCSVSSTFELVWIELPILA